MAYIVIIWHTLKLFGFHFFSYPIQWRSEMNKCVYVDLNYYMLVLFIIPKIYPLFSMSGFTLHHLIITCQCQLKKHRLGNEMSIQAYDGDIDAWFKL